MIYPGHRFSLGGSGFSVVHRRLRQPTRACETVTGFHDINRFITLGTHPGTDNLTIPAYVDALAAGEQPTGTTPIQVAQQVHDHADKALQILERFPQVTDKELRWTLGDIRAMAYLGKYYGHKIRGAAESGSIPEQPQPGPSDAAVER